MTYWRAGCCESSKSGSEGGGWKRAVTGTGPRRPPTLQENLILCLPSKEDSVMTRCLSLAVLALALVAAPVSAAGISGSYIEARTCDVWTGPCFANAEVNLGGKHAVLGWRIDKGSLDNVSLDGLGVVAVVAASDTLGIAQAGQ